MPQDPRPSVSPRRSSRLAFVALAGGTIGLGLWVHGGSTILNPTVRDVLGDALWAAMIMWWIAAAVPRARVAARSAAALGICVTVELSQIFHGPAIDSIRRTTLGHLVLGSGFDARDLVAYALGVSAAALLEWITLGRQLYRPRAS